MVEMGNGFAFVARQKHFQIGNSDFFADLILYSIPLHAYIVIELNHADGSAAFAANHLSIDLCKMFLLLFDLGKRLDDADSAMLSRTVRTIMSMPFCR